MLQPRIVLAVLFLVVVTNASGQILTMVDLADDTNDKPGLVDAEPSIAVDPTNPKNITIVAFSGGWKGPVWLSTTGGDEWSKVHLLPQPNPASTDLGDQKIVYDAKGNLFVVELAVGIDTPRCYVYRGGAKPGDDMIPGIPFGDDQPMIDVRGNDLLIAWNDNHHRKTADRVIVTRTDRMGKPIAHTAVGLAKKESRTPRIAVSPQGTAYIIFKTEDGAIPTTKKDKEAFKFEHATFYVVHSADGVHWSVAQPVHPKPAVTWNTNEWGNRKNGGRVGRAYASDAWIATHPVTGEVWAVFCDRDPTTGLGQIWATHSSDGESFSPPVRVTDGTRHSAYPEVAVASNGVIGVLYMDYDASGPSTVYAHRLARSDTNGVTWSQLELQTFTTQELRNGVDQKLWYDYNGLTAAGDMFLGVFCGKNLGQRQLTQFDPIFFKIAAKPQ